MNMAGSMSPEEAATQALGPCCLVFDPVGQVPPLSVQVGSLARGSAPDPQAMPGEPSYSPHAARAEVQGHQVCSAHGATARPTGKPNWATSRGATELRWLIRVLRPMVLPVRCQRPSLAESPSSTGPCQCPALPAARIMLQVAQPESAPPAGSARGALCS
jgi:hypothetical protein